MKEMKKMMMTMVMSDDDDGKIIRSQKVDLNNFFRIILCLISDNTGCMKPMVRSGRKSEVGGNKV